MFILCTDYLSCLALSSVVTEVTDCSNDSCFLRSDCEQCLSGNLACLWCPSLFRCVPSVSHAYPTTFNFGQCLGWVNSKDSCAMDQCEDQTNCNSCQLLPHCGWCNNPLDTGLGVCSPGGFYGPLRNISSCLVRGDNEGNQEGRGEWQFDMCSRELRF